MWIKLKFSPNHLSYHRSIQWMMWLLELKLWWFWRRGSMERVLSVDEISEQYWVAAKKESCKLKSNMNRSESEWAFQQFLQEAASPSSSSSSDVKDPDINININIPVTLNVDSQDYQTILKTKLNLACAAVALTRVCWCFYFLIFCFLPMFCRF